MQCGLTVFWLLPVVASSGADCVLAAACCVLIRSWRVLRWTMSCMRGRCTRAWPQSCATCGASQAEAHRLSEPQEHSSCFLQLQLLKQVLVWAAAQSYSEAHHFLGC